MRRDLRLKLAVNRGEVLLPPQVEDQPLGDLDLRLRAAFEGAERLQDRQVRGLDLLAVAVGAGEPGFGPTPSGQRGSMLRAT